MGNKLQVLSPSDTEKSHRILSIVLISTALIVIILAVYMQVGNYEFTNFDDPEYVTENPHVSSGITGKNIIWAFTFVEENNWHPITWLSHMADVELYGMNPRGHHLTNVIIHTVSSLLLLFLLLRFTGSLWQSSFVAFLFALHPLHVESVAWVAERKDVLSAFFWFLTLFLYSEYASKRKLTLYMLSLLTFVLGLMSKPMLVTLPIVMLLMDFWPLDRYRHEEQVQGQQRSVIGFSFTALVKKKIPFFACSLLSAVITIYAQNKGGAIKSFDMIPFLLRVENALIAYVKYIFKTFWPQDLAVLYPFPFSIPLWEVIGSLLLLLLVSVATFRVRHRHPYLLVGWFWFLVTLLPVIGLIQVGLQSMADRYTYIPLTGLFIMAAWGVPNLTKGLQHREGILSLLAGGVIITSASLTWQQLGYWRDGISLFRHALQCTAGNYAAHNQLGNVIASKGDLDAAIKEYQEALRLDPNFSGAHYNLGRALASEGNLDAAIKEYQEALRLDPNFSGAHNNLGVALAIKGDQNAAIKEYREALHLEPNYFVAHNNLGAALAGEGDLDAAIKEYQEALRLDPYFSGAHYSLGLALSSKGDLDAAIKEYQEALRLDPYFSGAHYHLGRALASKGDLDTAIKEYQEALRLDPNSSDAHASLGLALASKGDLDAAIKEYQEALRINPNIFKTQNYLRLALSQKRTQNKARK
jgi:tetratricopeptide (TPR) repeat protein